MKKINFILIFIFSYSLVFAQNEIDALRYSQSFQRGTSRSMGMGGAMGAIGGDLSVMSTNPAGIAVYRKTEISITPRLLYDNASSECYADKNKESDSKYNFGLNNIGIVATYLSGNETGWVSANFGMAFNRINDFNKNVVAEGVNSEGSMLDNFMYNSDNNTPDDLFVKFPYHEAMAYNSYLTSEFDTLDHIYTHPLLSYYGQTQRKIMNTTGGISEYSFSFAANYSHKIYIGATFGLQNVRYKETSTYKEIDESNKIPDFKSFQFQETISTHGTGINFKFGIIAKPLHWLRIGLALHTPTFFSLEEEYDTYMEAEYDTPDGDGISKYLTNPVDLYGDNLGPIISNFELTTPAKAIVSLGFVIKKQGIVSLEYERVNYSKARFRDASIDAGAYDYDYENDKVENSYVATNNFRVGGEYRIDAVSLRAGYAYYGNPFASEVERVSIERNSFSGGIGINNGNFFVDMAYVYTIYSSTQLWYGVFDDEKLVGADVNSQLHRFLVTLGFRF